ncbi:hypothetical protein B0H17DRAFT_1088707 [Mycena rosella]|uniref:Uncharacterized protein n=1 Tax=Mycena rosella TaxID=1033263 RepID=A0AAD7CWK0_MYCRO|nr:hypothetical protein B0H17DRAFT_1088707 [Mycena rosella]
MPFSPLPPCFHPSLAFVHVTSTPAYLHVRTPPCALVPPRPSRLTSYLPHVTN